MSNTTHVVLVGLMGAGKSTVGSAVARTLGWHFADTDQVVASLAGKSVVEIFDHDGEAAFRLAELAALDTLLDEPSPRVIATGGGAVTTEEARKRLIDSDEHILTIWLDVSPGTAVSRIIDPSTRPLLEGNPVGRLQVIASERHKWYELVSDVHIDVNQKSVSQAIEAVLEAVGGAASWT